MQTTTYTLPTPTVTIKPDADILADTRWYLETHGWSRNAMKDHLGRVCGLGAIGYSQGWMVFGTINAAAWKPMTRIAKKILDAAGVEVPDDNVLGEFANWNDMHVVNQQHLLDVIARAEKIERAGYDPDKGTTL